MLTASAISLISILCRTIIAYFTDSYVLMVAAQLLSRNFNKRSCLILSLSFNLRQNIIVPEKNNPSDNSDFK